MRVWRPTRVLRVLEVLNTSTRPLRVQTDEGAALAKYMGNRQGLDALCAELISAELLKLLHLDTPEHAVVWMEAFEVPEKEVQVQAGPAFLTRWQETAMTFSGSGELLKRIGNPDAIPQVLVFDTWVRNLDRFVASPDSAGENLDNLLFVPDGNRIRMLVIDHSHAFSETTLEDGIDEEWWQDRTICGTLPNFAEFLREDSLHTSLDKICEINAGQLNEIMENVPYEWGLTMRTKERLVDGLLQKAREMQDWLPKGLLRQPPLSFQMGRRK
ncbi:MAG: HipA family kinase [Rhodosalinus sp.]